MRVIRRYLHLTFLELVVGEGLPCFGEMAVMTSSLVFGRVATGGTVAVLLLVLLAALLHAIWNFMAKLIDDQVLGFWLINAAVSVSGGVLVLIVGVPSHLPWLLLAASTCIHVAYNLFLLNSYRFGDLSKVYPIARGMAPPLVTVGAAVFTGEGVPPLQLAGVVVVVLALLSLSDIGSSKVAFEKSSVLFAVLTGVMIASYSLVDGIASRQGENPLSYVGVLMMSEGTLITCVLSIKLKHIWPKHTPVRSLVLGIAAGGVSVITYGIVVWSQKRAPLAEVSALRETSVVFASLLGTVFLGEGSKYKRVFAGAVVFVGVLIMLI